MKLGCSSEKPKNIWFFIHFPLTLQAETKYCTSMKKLLTLTASLLLCAGGFFSEPEDELTVTSKFKYTWNINETVERNRDGVIIYKAQPYGGLVASFKERNLPVDWSGYESITFEFAEPTKVLTQVMISENMASSAKPGITILTCYFDGQDVRSVGEVALQAADTTTIYLKSVRLALGGAKWESTPIWEGECRFGNWENGIIIPPEKFDDALEGDKLEFIFTTDRSDLNVNYWQFKTVYQGTDKTLEGNDNELNAWGCAMVGRLATSYRIYLTAKDVATLKEKGLFVNGYYNNVTQCNLLKKQYDQ